MIERVATDVLGEPYEAETIRFPPDAEGPVVATLVRRRAPGTAVGAVLHVHGFSDYFFQTELADWWVERGYDFYALDLRKCGRSRLPHQTAHYVDDLHEYDADLDAAWHRITERDGHERVVIVAHSTGGLITPLWASERGHELAGMALNSPWFDLQGPAYLRGVGTAAIKRIAGRRPRTEFKRKVEGYYTRWLHHELQGEWEFDLELKPEGSFPVYLGWLAAIRAGHARLHEGLDVRAPVLVLSSDATELAPRGPDDEAITTRDIVLDVEHIRRWSPAVGRHVTYVAVPSAIHDVFLSPKPARERAYEELDRWHAAYVGR